MLNFTMGNNNSREGNWGEIRPRDETGHRTGLGTIAREFVARPIDTTQAIGAFASSYSEMRKANTVGGNIPAHENANYKATKIMGNPKLAAGISAAREEYKNFRVSSGDGPARKGYGDTRTPQERQNTMEANQRGRDQAMAELKNNSREGNWGEIRPRDETGHRTGLGTIAREFVARPIDTTQAIGAFASSYSEMRKANTVGGNIPAHENANYKATKIMGNPKLAAGISAAREEYKNFRVSSGDGPARKGYGDTRTPQERQNTMEANQRGRDQAMAELKNNSREGNWGEIRPRDETGHRTGLGTIAREFVARPIDTTQAIGAFASSYSEMRKANTVGGNIPAHENANYKATKIMGNPKLAAGISAAREEYKNFRVSSGDGPARKGYGDTRTPQERQNTMEANQRGRDQAMAELKKK